MGKVKIPPELKKTADAFKAYDQEIFDEGAKSERGRLLKIMDVDIPDCVFASQEAKSVGFTKRSFLEAGWRKVNF